MDGDFYNSTTTKQTRIASTIGHVFSCQYGLDKYFHANLSDWWLGNFLWTSSQPNVAEPYWW